MISDYVNAALSRAHYEIIDDPEPYYGEVSELSGVYATGKTLEQCRENLREVIEGWILLSVRHELSIPEVEGIKITSPEKDRV